MVTRRQFDVQKENAHNNDNDPYRHRNISSNSIALDTEVGRFRHRSSGFIVANIKALSLSTGASYLGSASLKKKMKYFLIVCLAVAAYGADHYSSKYDNFDVDTLISNDRLLKSYINCFLDKGRCTPEGADFKKTLPEAVETTCVKCTEKQKQLIRKVIRAIQQKHPKQWEELQKKADPTGKFRVNFDKFISESR
ncbi:Ejaculatory bulb-specific protein 3 [Eumeta japonica]|uniref:Ejaculatory bulb-specific protein 3 n=1 Tax=Eumeta variegata TaxID=151549 RepID=A0A4C1SZW6_EUMVA|nr:Ejaculatory bulb-specific protein 3 [Eumeta japonica]